MNKLGKLGESTQPSEESTETRGARLWRNNYREHQRTVQGSRLQHIISCACTEESLHSRQAFQEFYVVVLPTIALCPSAWLFLLPFSSILSESHIEKRRLTLSMFFHHPSLLLQVLIILSESVVLCKQGWPGHYVSVIRYKNKKISREQKVINTSNLQNRIL